MADTTTHKLRLTFLDTAGSKFSQSWGRTKAANSIGRANVKQLITSILDNNTIFAKKPVEVSAADVITTTKTDFEVE